ncbi:MAG: hypothetical protein IIU14_05170 [Ruminococcus sp.]|nr:hypothetical protein [Ruminococcus sp.]
MPSVITSGKTNTTLYLDNTILGGVVDASYREAHELSPVREMLSSTPWFFKDRKTDYLIELRHTGDSALSFPNTFSLSFVSDGETVSFHGCAVQSLESSFDGSGRINSACKIISSHKERTNNGN